MKRSWQACVAVCAIGALSHVCMGQLPGQRKALIIGNSRYTELASLYPTTKNDANAVADALIESGFPRNNVVVLQDKGRDAILRAIADFSRSLTSEDSALFYFSGHGFSLDGENFIAPIDLRLPGESSSPDGRRKAVATLGHEGVSLNSILGSILRAKTRIVILDSCRNEPKLIARTKSTSDLATLPSSPMVGQAASGTLIAFATNSGNVANASSPGNLSRYTYYLVQEIKKHPPDLVEALNKARTAVIQASNGEQAPAIYTDTNGVPFSLESTHNSIPVTSYPDSMSASPAEAGSSHFNNATALITVSPGETMAGGKIRATESVRRKLLFQFRFASSNRTASRTNFVYSNRVLFVCMKRSRSLRSRRILREPSMSAKSPRHSLRAWTMFRKPIFRCRFSSQCYPLVR